MTDITSEHRKSLLSLLTKAATNVEKGVELMVENEYTDSPIFKKLSTLSNSASRLCKFVRERKDIQAAIKAVKVATAQQIATPIVEVTVSLLDSIKAQIEHAAMNRCKVAAIYGLVLVHAEQLSEISSDDFIAATGLEESYKTVFDTTLAQAAWLQANGYRIINVGEVSGAVVTATAGVLESMLNPQPKQEKTTKARKSNKA